MPALDQAGSRVTVRVLRGAEGMGLRNFSYPCVVVSISRSALLPVGRLTFTMIENSTELMTLEADIR